MTAPVPPPAEDSHPAPPVPPSALRLRLDRTALADNWRALDRLSGTARAGAAVKADAYGLGIREAGPVLRDSGCRDFFVAHWNEVPPLMQSVAAQHVSVLHGPMNDADVAFARATGVRPVLNSLDQAGRWLRSGGGVCDLMVDSGINRLGLPMSALGDPAIAALDIECCLSHLSSADEDTPINAQQLRRFDAIRIAVPARRYSLANSAGIALGAAYHADLTRPGLSLYGGIPRPELAAHIRQVAYPEAAIMQTRLLEEGDAVGYNATYLAPSPMRVGVVALGYADGYLRCWSGTGGFHWHGRALPVIGRVSMDMTVVDLTGAPECREGDWLSLDYDPVAAAQASGLSQYELFTLLGRRFDRAALA
ncbi:alanine racemase [Novosphingobium lentum]|uniref:alanine racemase n=1 Tax=Novosphingobium lentum TaxID=145287 RepID=UPI0008364203|nr:alanine racemase [Novosphingobium lentum]